MAAFCLCHSLEGSVSLQDVNLWDLSHLWLKTTFSGVKRTRREEPVRPADLNTTSLLLWLYRANRPPTAPRKWVSSLLTSHSCSVRSHTAHPQVFGSCIHLTHQLQLFLCLHRGGHRGGAPGNRRGRWRIEDDGYDFFSQWTGNRCSDVNCELCVEILEPCVAEIQMLDGPTKIFSLIRIK